MTTPGSMDTKRVDEDRPADPLPGGDIRWALAEEFLRGKGLEIGALHLAMRLPANATVRYVDRMSVPDLREHYPELATLDLADVDVIDNGETLETVAAESVDFIVANHFLEHCQDPIRTVSTHLSKLRPGGVLFYAVPDKRYTFDFRRDRTPLQHHVEDHEHGPERSRSEHYLQWATHVHEGTGPPSPEQAQAYAHVLEAEDYSIHFHVWEETDLIALMLYIQQRLGGFDIEAVRRNGIENIVVLRKYGELPEPVVPIEPAAELMLPAPVAPVPAPVAEMGAFRIPLAALRGTPTPPDSNFHWSIDPDGTAGRALVMPAGTSWRVPVLLRGPVRFEAQVRLLPHDWRDGRREIRASVTGIDRDGTHLPLWSALVPSAAAGGNEAGAETRCEVPETVVELLLTIDPPLIRDPGSVGIAAWIEPALVDPSGPILTAAANEPNASTASGSDEEGPRFSIVTPVHDPPVAMLREAIESVRAQTFLDWELCLCDDASRNPEVIATLNHYAATDDRVRLIRHEQAQNISAATNAAMSLATGQFIVLLDHDDLVVPNALELMEDALRRDPELDFVYSDETIVSDGRSLTQSLKPGWSPETLQCLMYTCHLGVYRRSIAVEIGGFRSQYDGCQDYDFTLRFTERTSRVAHIPCQLYQWRAHAASTAGGDQAKPYAYLAQPRALAEHLQRCGIDGEVRFGALPGFHRIVHRVPADATVTVALGTNDPADIAALLRSLHDQPHPRWELVIAADRSSHDRILGEYAEGTSDGSRLRLVDSPPNVSVHHALAAAALAADGDYVLLMDSPALGLTAEWLTALIGYVTRSAIGIAGPLVLSADGMIAESGLVFPAGLALSMMGGEPAERANSVAMNVSALNGLGMVTRRTLEHVGGLDPSYGSLTIAELSVRLLESGRRNVIVPDSRLQYLGREVVPNDLGALGQLRQRWLTHHPADPLYNPQLRSDRADNTPLVRL